MKYYLKIKRFLESPFVMNKKNFINQQNYQHGVTSALVNTLINFARKMKLSIYKFDSLIEIV